MKPPTFDDRAAALTKSLLIDARRLPARAPRQRPTATPWKAIVVFAATAVVIGGAVVGASVALHGGPVAKTVPASPEGHWERFQLPPMGSSTDAVSCPNASYCVAVDYSGDVFVSTNPSGGTNAWTVRSVDPYTTVPPGEEVTGVSCAGPSLCVAVDQRGDIITSTNPGGGVAAWTLSRLGGAGALSAISCPAVTLCVAVGGNSPYLNQAGVVLASTDPAGGSPWTAPGPPQMQDVYGLTAISCPTTTFCAATDEDGDVITSTDPSGVRPWKVTRLASVYPFDAISCPTVHFCAAVDRDGDVVTSNDPNGGASTWTATTLDSSLTLWSVSCPTARFCVVGAGLSDSVFVSDDPTGGSGAWTSMRVIPQGPEAMFGLSCPSTRFCVGVDGGDGAHIYSNPNG